MSPIELSPQSKWTRFNVWLTQNWKLGWLLLAVLPLKWGIERQSPFDVVQYIEPAGVHAGEQVVFAMPVRRQLKRDCDAHWTRHVIDALGVRHDYDGVHFTSAASIQQEHDRLGPWLRVAVPMPVGMPAGRSVVVTEIEYQCNPLHAFWPIRVSLFFPVEVIQ